MSFRFNANRPHEPRETPESFLALAKEHLAKARVRGDAESLAALTYVTKAERMLTAVRRIEHVAVVGKQCSDIRSSLANLPRQDDRFKYLSPADYEAKVRELAAKSNLRGVALMAGAQAMMEAAGFRLRGPDSPPPTRRFSETRTIAAPLPPPPPRLAPVTREDVLAAISLRKVATPQYLSPSDYEELVEDVSADVMEIPGNQLRGNSLRVEARTILGELGYHRRGS